MAGRPLRHNKAMSESPRIVAAVEAAFAKLRPMSHKELIVPWEDFVFSVRDGKPYLPPTLAEGILRVKRGAGNVGAQASAKGVRLFLAVGPVGGYSGAFHPDSFKLSVSSDRPSVVIRHELLHFVQEVGSGLIRVKEGRPAFGVADEDIPDPTFGLPKKRIQTRDTWKTFPKNVAGEHGRRDPEHYPNAMSLALFAIHYAKMAGRPTSERVAQEIAAHAGQFTLLFDVPATRAKKLGLPKGLRMPGRAREVALKQAAWEYASRDLGMSGVMPPEVAKILGISAKEVALKQAAREDALAKTLGPASEVELEQAAWEDAPVRRKAAPAQAKKAPAAALRVEKREDGWYVSGKRYASQNAATLALIRQMG